MKSSHHSTILKVDIFENLKREESPMWSESHIKDNPWGKA